MRNTNSRLIVIILIAIVAMLTFTSCKDRTVEEFPLKADLDYDFISYVSYIADDDVVFYTLTIKEKDYIEDDKQVDYYCSVQYKWPQLDEIFTDDCILTYKLDDEKWVFSTCTSEAIDLRVSRKFKIYNLFYDNIYTVDNIIPEVPEKEVELSDDLYDYIFALNDVTYKLPRYFSDFTANGWKISSDSQHNVLDHIEPNSFGTLDMVNQESSITVYLINLTDKPIMIGQSLIGGIKVRSDNSYLQIGPNIDSNSSEQEIRDIYKTPSTSEKTDSESKLTYDYDDFVSSTFKFTEEYTEIEVLNFYDEVKLKSPAPLFDSFSFNFIAGDDYYSIPCQLDLFIENGWTITRGGTSRSTLFWYESVELTISRDEESIDLLVENISLSELNVTSCLVTKVFLSEENLGYDIINYTEDETVSITPGLEEDEILEFFGPPTKTIYIDGDISLLYTYNNTQYVRLTLGESTDIELSAVSEENFSLFDRFTFDIDLGEDYYALPFQASLLVEQGWAPKYGWDLPIMAGGWSEVALENEDGHTITAYICNINDEETTLDECVVGGIYKQGNDIPINLSGGIDTTSSLETVLDTYGLPYSEKVDGDIHILMYKSSINEFLCLSFDNGAIDKVWIVNFLFPIENQDTQ